MKKSKRKVQNKGKRLLSVVLATLTIGSTVVTTGSLTGVGISASAVSDTVETSESDFEYKINVDGTVTIIGYNGSDTELIIPSEIDGKSVTEIGWYAFKDCAGLKSVTIPNSVKEIGIQAFLRCSNLKNVLIPNSVTSIGESAFANCIGLTSITIPDSVTSIGSWAFGNTAWYNHHADGLVYAGKVAYEYKGKMPSNTNIVLKNGTKGISGSAFKNCTELKSVAIPNSVTSIGFSAFSGCTGLTSITIPNSVTSIGTYAFWNCKGLTSVKISNKIKEIAHGTFNGCTGLTSITIPDSVTYIGDFAFSDCTELISVVIPGGVTSIGDATFSDCTGLTSITIPDSVTSIGSGAFSNCTGLTSVTIPDSVISIDNKTFRGCTGLTSITIPDSITSIGSDAFSNCTGLTSVTIPDSVISIDNKAFRGCTGLTSITIPDSVTEIGDYAFGYYYDGYDWTDKLIDGFTIYGTEGSKAETYANENNIPFVDINALANNSTISKTTITKGESVTLKAIATGGTAPYQYAFSAKHSTATKWTTLKGYNTTSTKTWTPGLKGTYQVCAKVKDANGTEVKKFFTVTVKAAPLANNSTISKTTINKGDTITLRAVATGGTAPYQYAFSAKHSTSTKWTTLKGYNTTATKTWTPGLTGTYQVCAKVKDAKGTEVKKFFTLTVNPPLNNNSTISKTTITKGESITLKAVAKGGTAPYQYAFLAKHSTATKWTTLKGYNTTSTKTWTPGLTGTYQVCAKVKDANGTEVKKFFTVTVKAAPLANNSTISKTTINKGETITLKAVATGGTAPYQYAFSAKHSTSTKWTTLKGYNTTSTKTWTPGLTGTYQVCAKVKDAKGTEVKKFFTLTVE